MLPLQSFHALKTKSPPQAARLLQNRTKIASSYKRPLQRATRLQSWVSFLLLTSLAQVLDSVALGVNFFIFHHWVMGSVGGNN